LLKSIQEFAECVDKGLGVHMIKQPVLVPVPVPVPVPVQVPGGSGRSPDVSIDDMTAMVYEGDLHALLESREMLPSTDADKGMLERLRDAVWPFIR
jgi:hypothetical protein